MNIKPVSGSSYLDEIRQLQSKMQTTDMTGKQNLKQEDFMSLLSKQLQHQDPFNPVENDQMISQMASFATIDGIGSISKQFESLNASMTSSKALQASSLVGRDVLVPNSKGAKIDQSGINGVVKLPSEVSELTVRVENEFGQLVRSFDIGGAAMGEQAISWDGLDDKGQATSNGLYKMVASAVINGRNTELPIETYANVNSVLLGNGDGNVLLNLAGFSAPIKLAEVKEVGKSRSSRGEN